MIANTKLSKGHLYFDHGYEYIAGHKYIFKADIRDPIECTGRRECAKLICTIDRWNASTRGKHFPAVSQEVKAL
jgi:hypothetical protein